MAWGILRNWQTAVIVMLAMLVSMICAQPALANAAGPPCLIEGELPQLEENAAHTDFATLRCENENREPVGGDWTLLFEVGDDQPRPTFLNTRIGHFSQLDIVVVNADGEHFSSTLRLSDLSSGVGRPYMHAALPEYSGDASWVAATFRDNGNGPTLSKAGLAVGPPAPSDIDIIQLMIFAALMGALLIPIVLDAAILVILRKPFLAWHILLSISFASIVAARANIFGMAFDIPPNWLRVGLIMSMSTSLAVALMFARSFIEPGKISPWVQRLVVPAAIWSICVGIVQSAFPTLWHPVSGSFHAIGMAMSLAVLAAAMISACANKSRSVIFQLCGWGPMVLASMIQISTHLLPFAPQTDAIPLLFFGIFFEGIATVMGVADRFLIMRRERDAAVTEARMLEQLSERDPLTGLMNRRAVEARFTDLREQGFDTFALVDLDLFKDINDRFGHQVGDKALIACAEALRGGDNRDTIAVRLGGEEFVVLMRGKRTVERLEALRQMVPVRIARDVEGIDRPVTASMGVIELPRAKGQMMDFDELYARADQLAYEAKAYGRNRMCFERLKVFDTAPEVRPKIEAVA